MKTKNKYSIRKISAGTASVLIGSLLFLSPQISADELTDEEYEVNEETLVDNEVIVEQNAFEDQIDEKNKEVSTSISEDYNETPNINDISLNESLENDEPTLDTQTDEVLSQEEETIDDQLAEEKVLQEESAEEDNGEMFDISNEKELEDRELSHDTHADEVLTQEGELVDLHLVDKVELQVESSVEPNADTIDNDIEEEMNDTEVIFEEAPVEVEDTGEVIFEEAPVEVEDTGEAIVEEMENKVTEIHNENISNEILIEDENVEEEVLNNKSFKIGEEQDLESGTYEFQFDASLSHEAEINIHNSEGELIDSFNIRENTNYRTWNVSLVLKEGDSVEVIGAEATTKKIDDIYTEYVEPRDIFKVPHGYHEISEEGNIRPGVYRVGHRHRNGDFSIGVIDNETGEFIPRNEDRGNVGREWPLPVNFYAGETILIENIDHFELDRIPDVGVDTGDNDNQEINPDGSLISEGYYHVGSDETINPGLYYFGFVRTEDDPYGDHMTFVNLRNSKGEIKDRFQLSGMDFRDEGKDVVLLEGDTFEIVNNKVYFKHFGDIYGHNADDIDRGLHFYLSHGYHQVSEDSQMLKPGTYIVQHMAEGGVLSIGYIDDKTGEFVPKNKDYSEMTVHLDNPIEIDLSAGEVIKIDRINHLSFYSMTYRPDEESPIEEEDNSEVETPSEDDENDNGSGHEDSTEQGDNSIEESSDDNESTELENNLNEKSPGNIEEKESPKSIIPTDIVTESSIQVESGTIIAGESIAPGTYLITNLDDEVGGNISILYKDEYGNEVIRYAEVVSSEYGTTPVLRVTIEEGQTVSIENTDDLLFTPATDIAKNESELGVIPLENISSKTTENATGEKESLDAAVVSVTDTGDGTTTVNSAKTLPDTGVNQQNNILFATILVILGLGFLVIRNKKA